MRTYVTLPDELWKAVSAVAKKNGQTFASQVRVYLASVPEVKAARSMIEKEATQENAK